MQYGPLCSQMSAAGWLSYVVAGCNADHRHGDGKKHFLARRLLKTLTGASFTRGQKAPPFDRTKALPATLHFHDEHGWCTPAVLIDRAANLVAANEYGRLLVAYLSDIPADRFTLARPPPRRPRLRSPRPKASVCSVSTAAANALQASPGPNAARSSRKRAGSSAPRAMVIFRKPTAPPPSASSRSTTSTRSPIWKTTKPSLRSTNSHWSAPTATVSCTAPAPRSGSKYCGRSSAVSQTTIESTG